MNSTVLEMLIYEPVKQKWQMLETFIINDESLTVAGKEKLKVVLNWIMPGRACSWIQLCYNNENTNDRTSVSWF